MNIGRRRFVFGFLLISILILFGACSPKEANIFSKEDKKVLFDLYSQVYDYGQRINRLEFELPEKVNDQDLFVDTFVVKTKNSLENEKIQNGERKIKNIYLEGNKKEGTHVIIELESELDSPYSSTLFWDDEKFSNLPLNISYELKQNKKIGNLNKLEYKQRSVLDSQVDLLKKGISKNGLYYRDFKPKNKGSKHPLIIWFHGAGEGGDNNISHVTANKGATAFLNDEIQQILDYPYVLAPQSPDYWMPELTVQDRKLEGKNRTELIIALIKEYISQNPSIDKERVYLIGASMGGYQVWETLSSEPSLFAAAIPICAAYQVPNDHLDKLKDKPLWLVHAKTDDTIPFEYSENAYNYLKKIGSKAIFSTYNDVKVGNASYSTHASWIYVLNDISCNNDTFILEWLSQQKNNTN